MNEPEIILEVEDSINSFQNLIVSTNMERRPNTNSVHVQNHNQNKGGRKSYNQRIISVLEDAQSSFLADFDPETSARRRRKLLRFSVPDGNTKQSLIDKQGRPYDSKGIFRPTGEDLCDCLDTKCPGCHFPCPSCGSNKCGATCRCSRKWMYEQIEYDAKDCCIYNKYAKPSKSNNLK